MKAYKSNVHTANMVEQMKERKTRHIESNCRFALFAGMFVIAMGCMIAILIEG